MSDCKLCGATHKTQFVESLNAEKIYCPNSDCTLNNVMFFPEQYANLIDEPQLKKALDGLAEVNKLNQSLAAELERLQEENQTLYKTWMHSDNDLYEAQQRIAELEAKIEWWQNENSGLHKMWMKADDDMHAVKQRITELESDNKRLIEFAANACVSLRDDCIELITESLGDLPILLQDKIIAHEESIDSKQGEGE